MKRAVLAARDPAPFTPLAQMLQGMEISIDPVRTGKALIGLVSAPGAGRPIDLVILCSDLGKPGPKPLVAAIVQKSPGTLCVVAGQMAEKDFHETFEGLGVLMQIPPRPDAGDAARLKARLQQLAALGGL